MLLMFIGRSCPLLCQGEAASVPQHVRVRLEPNLNVRVIM